MIHLIRNQKTLLYDVVVMADNNVDQLHHSKQGFERKLGAHKHIVALAEQMGNSGDVTFQDNTGDKPVIMRIENDLDVFHTDLRARSKYIASGK